MTLTLLEGLTGAPTPQGPPQEGQEEGGEGEEGRRGTERRRGTGSERRGTKAGPTRRESTRSHSRRNAAGGPFTTG